MLNLQYLEKDISNLYLCNDKLQKIISNLDQISQIPFQNFVLRNITRHGTVLELFYTNSL